jgi:hypothetical protein
MNLENFNKVLAVIEADPSKWNQGEWHSECGTKHCIAGWSQILAGRKANINTVRGDAREFLDLTSFEAEWLFNPRRTIDNFKAVSSGKFLCYDSNGYDSDGYDSDGYDRDGYNRYGYDRDGYDSDGYDRDGYIRAGFDYDGYDRAGFSRDGYDRDGYDRAGYDRVGYARAGYDRAGYDRAGFDHDGLNRKNLRKSSDMC